MVLVMGSDGSLSPSRAQSNFARTYNDGIGQGSASDGLRIFGEDKDTAENDEFRLASVATNAPAPRPDILAAIEETGLRYAGHPGLRAADITVSDSGVGRTSMVRNHRPHGGSAVPSPAAASFFPSSS